MDMLEAGPKIGSTKIIEGKREMNRTKCVIHLVETYNRIQRVPEGKSRDR